MKRLFLIAGPNGAGKTTASFTILPELLNCKEFVNADEIARGLSPLDPERAAFSAGRIMLDRIEALVNSEADFAFETTLSSHSPLSIIKNAQAKGYVVTLMFFYLRSSELAKSRVRTRVNEGGHNIPDDVIVRRYVRGLVNFFDLYRSQVNDWVFVENSGRPYRIIATGQNGRDIIQMHDIWSILLEKHAT